MLQDPLALLSDGESSEEPGHPAEPATPGEPPCKRPRNAAQTGAGDALASTDAAAAAGLQLSDLLSAGYTPAELCETDAYRRESEGQARRRAQLQPLPAAPRTGAEALGEGEAAPEAEEECPREEGRQPSDAAVDMRASGGGVVPGPWGSFREGALPPALAEPLALAGFDVPTPIQAHACPVLGEGRDLVAIAPTGSGKTLAYLLPSLAQLLRPGAKAKWRQPGSPLILVLAPTRELAGQIEKEAERFRGPSGIRTACVYGGASAAQQLAGLRSNPDLVVATPGRLNDFLQSNQASCSVHGVRFLVLDEADRMLDDGFEDQVRAIVELCVQPARQTMLFSATWPEHVRRLGADFLRDPVELRVGHAGELRASGDVAQDVMLLPDPDEKPDALVGLLNGRPKAKVLVFVSTKRTCNDLMRCLRGRVSGYCDAIHGDRSQAEREAALAAFRSGAVRVLFATDVAGRGLDVKGVTLVVNFDPPKCAEDYVHRVGRTGRGGHRGVAISMLTWQDTAVAPCIAGVITRSGGALPPSLLQLLKQVGASAPLDRRRQAAAECKARAAEHSGRLAQLAEKSASAWEQSNAAASRP